MRHTLILPAVFLSFLIVGCQAPEPAENEAPIVQTALAEQQAELIINLTSNVNEAPESSLMALHFALKARENDIPVTVFLNVQGVHLASTASGDIIFNEENLQDIIRQITERGGKVVACPMCMKVQGISEEDLMEEIQVSSPGLIMQKLRENPTVFTY